MGETDAQAVRRLSGLAAKRIRARTVSADDAGLASSRRRHRWRCDSSRTAAIAGDAPPAGHRTEGEWLEAAGGRRTFDAISSWWIVTHGHRYPPIMEAIRTQTNLLDQIIFAGFTHPPAEQLARRLIAINCPRSNTSSSPTADRRRSRSR
jgi:adenosylmethionine-8-amino-7-oxononanoate aminotransferase